MTKSNSCDLKCQILLFCDREWTPISYGLSEVIDIFMIQVRVIQVRVYGCQIHHVFFCAYFRTPWKSGFFSYILTKIHKMTNSYDRMKLYYPFYQEKRILIWLYHGRWPDLSTTNLTLKVWNLIQDTIFKHRTLSVLYYVATYSAKRANLSKSL